MANANNINAVQRAAADSLNEVVIFSDIDFILNIYNLFSADKYKTKIGKYYFLFFNKNSFSTFTIVGKYEKSTTFVVSKKRQSTISRKSLLYIHL